MNSIRPSDNLPYKQKAILPFLLVLLLPALALAQLNVTMSGVSPTCNGWTNGSVGASVSNGTAPFMYSWNNGPSTGSNTLPSIGAGTYNVAVTDANNQTGTAVFTLTEPSAIVVDVTATGGCMGGNSAAAAVTGGTGGYSYLWDNGATGSSASGLSFGVHCVTVTDGNGCQSVGCATLSDALSIDMVVQGLACFNFCDASVTALVSGGTTPYTYDWSNGNMGAVNENLGPGTYSVTATDAAGCTITGSATVGNPVQIDIDVTITNPPCASGANGSASANATGGTSPYTYNWSNGASGPSVNNLAPGTYGLTVTDFLGCQETTDVVVVEDGGIDLTVNANPSSGCGATDGSSSVMIDGGVAPYSVQWSNGSTGTNTSGLAPGNYTVMVTDANGCGATASFSITGSAAIDLNITGVNSGCAANGSANAMVTPGSGTPPFQFNWNTGATTAIINNITDGTYMVTVTDAAGCTATDQITVSSSSDIGVSTTVNSTSCFNNTDGSATANVTGATGSISYLWNNGGNTQTINNLAAGTYFVTVVDNASGCTATINAFVSQPSEVVANSTAVAAGCSSPGSAEASATGGTAPYTFMWSNGESGQTIDNLAAGTYTVTATDANGCTDESTVTVSGGGSLNVQVDITNLISNSTTDDGAVEASASGGVQPYTYLWNTGVYGPILTGLAGGTYTVTVTDVEGCTGVGTVTLVQLGCIGNRVWEDENRDGCQDPGELGRGGINVTLIGTDENGNAVNMSQVTQPNGYYLFEDLQPGDYTVEVDLPTNYAFSPANACTDDFTDSDFNANGQTGNIDLAMGQCNITISAGIYDDCLNIATPGEICCNQYICGPGNDPEEIESTIPASGGGSPVQYMWMYSTMNVPFNTNFWSAIPGATSASYDPGPLQETTYFIRCAKASACDEWKETNSVKIEVGTEAYASISGPDLVCVGDPATYTAASNGPNATYSWDFGSWATPQTSTDPNPTVTWNSFGVVYITLTVENDGCVSSTELGVAISNSPILCGNGLVINTNETNNAVGVQWEMERAVGDYSFVVQRSANGIDFMDLGTMPQSQVDGVNEYSFMDYFPKSGNAVYRVQLMKGDDHMSFSNEVQVQRFKQSEMFVTYPNPVVSKMIIETSNDVSTAVQAEILSTQGKLVAKDAIEAGSMSHSIDMTGLRSGIYFLRLTYNNGDKEVIRVIKR